MPIELPKQLSMVQRSSNGGSISDTLVREPTPDALDLADIGFVLHQTRWSLRWQNRNEAIGRGAECLVSGILSGNCVFPSYTALLLIHSMADLIFKHARIRKVPFVPLVDSSGVRLPTIVALEGCQGKRHGSAEVGSPIPHSLPPPPRIVFPLPQPQSVLQAPLWLAFRARHAPPE